MTTASDHSMSVGRAIRDVRTQQGISLRALASRLGISPSTLSALETGHTSVSVTRLAQIADTLSVVAADLLTPGIGTIEPRPASDPDAAGAQSAEVVAGIAIPEATEGWRDFPPLELSPPVAGALDAFLQYGYHGASMRIIAERAGISAPGIYHHYASKQDLLAAIMDLTMLDLLSRSRGALAEGADQGPADRFRLLVECLARFQTNRRELGFLGRSETRSLEGEGADRLHARRLEMQKMIDTEIAAAVAEGTFHVHSVSGAGRAVTNLCSSLVHWFRPGGKVAAEQVAMEYVGYCLRIVGAAEPPAARPG